MGVVAELDCLESAEWMIVSRYSNEISENKETEEQVLPDNHQSTINRIRSQFASDDTHLNDRLFLPLVCLSIVSTSDTYSNSHTTRDHTNTRLPRSPKYQLTTFHPPSPPLNKPHVPPVAYSDNPSSAPPQTSLQTHSQ